MINRIDLNGQALTMPVKTKTVEPVAVIQQPEKSVIQPHRFSSLMSLPNIRFGSQLEKNYNVEHRVVEPLDSGFISSMLRNLLIRDVLKKEKKDTGNLQLFLDLWWTSGYRNQNRAASADLFAMIDRPVDVIVKEYLDVDGLLALQQATGKRFMYEYARISLGPVLSGAGFTRNDDHAIRRELQNEYIRDLEHAIMTRAGVNDRTQVYQDINSAKKLTSMQALYYGEKGLVDAIVVGHDKVVTRADLMTYLDKQSFSPDELAEFLNDRSNIKKLPKRSLREFSPESVTKKGGSSKLDRVAIYREPRDIFETEKKDDIKEGEDDEKGKLAPNDLVFYQKKKDKGFVRVRPENIPLKARIKKENVISNRLAIDNMTTPRSFFEDDVIYFNDAFVDETAEQVTDALLELDQKKQKSGLAGHVKIVVNSPGGAIISGNEIRNTIHQMRSKVDVIVTGMAASCGAFLVSSATGLRVMTPNARIMIHDAWRSQSLKQNQEYNENIDGLDQNTIAIVGAIAEASGRTFKQVWEDMKIDIWLNPLEAMFYGRKGLADVILVGENKAITKADVLNYLEETLEGKDNVKKYLRERIKSLRVGKRDWQPEEHDENDPFENPLKTIQIVARRSARPVGEIKEMKHSIPKNKGSINFYTVAFDKDGKGNKAMSDRSQTVLNWLQDRWGIKDN